MKTHILFLMTVVVAASFSAETTAPVKGVDVKLTDLGKQAVLDNGILSVTLNKASATLASLKFRDAEMIYQGARRANVYFSMDGGPDYRQPKNCTFSVKTESPEMVDVACRCTWEGEAQALDIEAHFVLRRGDSGLYVYALLDHPAAYPATVCNEWRMVWRTPAEPQDWICVDEQRHWQMPDPLDYQTAQKTSIKEIVKLTQGARAGLYDCKYEFNASYYDLGCWGHVFMGGKTGAWIVCGGYDFFNDGPTKRDLNAAAGVNHIHFGMNHYDGSKLHIAAKEKWSKIYGPFLLYCNSAPDVSTMWSDAKARVKKEKAKWPYAWLTGLPQYPSAEARGQTTGRFIIRDPLKPDLKSSGAWVGLAQPEAGGNWQSESKHYQYWTRADAEGRFTIPNVRPGSYTLSAFVKGAVGEFAKQNVIVKAEETTGLGEVIWDVPHAGTRIAWEIGVPDRTAAEFRHGDDYFRAFIWKQFSQEFSNPLDFTIGQSDPAKDWNYAHCAYIKDGKAEPWPWSIHFRLDALPASGDATLIVAIASHESSHLQVFVNDSRKAHVLHRLEGDGSNALMRQSIHGKYEIACIAIPVSKLRTGDNTLTLLTTRYDGPASHVMYDYLCLELP